MVLSTSAGAPLRELVSEDEVLALLGEAARDAMRELRAPRGGRRRGRLVGLVDAAIVARQDTRAVDDQPALA